MTPAFPRSCAVGWWLMLVALLIAGMVILGGLTRLTGSGLSITEWRPVTGAVPPLSQQAWETEFHRYRQIPQYKLENRGMTLAEFKNIYWWEWTHRLLGRLIGVVFLLPFLWFVWTGAIGREAVPRMILLFVLGGLQGAVGWWMVQSGLETRVSVSQYRLAVHLGMALLLFAAVFWTALEYLRANTIRARLARRGVVFASFVYLQMLLGALVAGLHAGLIYNTWPLMDGRRVFPEHPFFSRPFWINIFENPGLAQFDHRIGAYVIAVLALWLWLKAAAKKPSGLAPASSYAILILTTVQIALGIQTLLHQAPVILSALHQTTALLLFTAALWHAFELERTAPAAATAALRE